MNNFRSHYSTGFFSLAFATLLYGFYGVVSKIVGIDFGVFFLGWSRSLVIALIVFVYFFFVRQWIVVRKEHYKWFATMSTFGIASFLAIFVAFNRLPIGVALFTYYASSTLASYCIGYVLFKEKFTASKILLLGISLMGLLLLFYDRFQSGSIALLLLACFSGVAGAVWNVFSKKVSPVYPTTQIIFIDALIAIAISLPLSLLTSEPVALSSFTEKLPIIVLFAGITVGSNIFTLIGFKYLAAQIASIIMLLEAVYGVIFGWLFFKEILSPLEMIGGMFIILSVAFSHFVAKNSQTNVQIYERRNKKKLLRRVILK